MKAYIVRNCDDLLEDRIYATKERAIRDLVEEAKEEAEEPIIVEDLGETVLIREGNFIHFTVTEHTLIEGA